MKKIIEVFKLLFVFISTITIILTMLSTYHILPNKHFNSYLNIEVCLLVTFILSAVQSLQYKERENAKALFVLYLFMVFCSVFFIVMKVY